MTEMFYLRSFMFITRRAKISWSTVYTILLFKKLQATFFCDWFACM